MPIDKKKKKKIIIKAVFAIVFSAMATLFIVIMLFALLLPEEIKYNKYKEVPFDIGKSDKGIALVDKNIFERIEILKIMPAFYKSGEFGGFSFIFRKRDSSFFHFSVKYVDKDDVTVDETSVVLSGRAGEKVKKTSYHSQLNFSKIVLER